jgi:hypothetical protein
VAHVILIVYGSFRLGKVRIFIVNVWFTVSCRYVQGMFRVGSGFAYGLFKVILRGRLGLV